MPIPAERANETHSPQGPAPFAGWTIFPKSLKLAFMSTLSAILEPSPDGTLHLPLPAAWRNLPIRIKAELEPVERLPGIAYTAEWLAAFGAISDDSFVAPVRDEPRAVDPLDAF